MTLSIVGVRWLRWWCPLLGYQQLRQAAEEQRVNEEFDAARTEYLACRDAGTIRYGSHEEAGRRLGMSSR
jgi:hypothetical protein